MEVQAGCPHRRGGLAAGIGVSDDRIVTRLAARQEKRANRLPGPRVDRGLAR